MSRYWRIRNYHGQYLTGIAGEQDSYGHPVAQPVWGKEGMTFNSRYAVHIALAFVELCQYEQYTVVCTTFGDLGWGGCMGDP
jgi:hypothetical protein